MAQHDYNIANQGFSSFRSDLNNALSAIQTTNSGTSRPTGAVAGQIWLDTTSATSPTLKFYDGADDISFATIDYTANTVNWLDSNVSVTGLTTTATGTVITLSDTANTSTVNLIIDNQKEVRFRETTANGVNYVGFKAPASLSADKIWILPSADGTAGQFLKTDGAGNLSFDTVGGSTTPFAVIGNATSGSEIRLPEDTDNGANYIAIKAPDTLASNLTLTLPSADGTSGQVLQTNGSGVLSFAAVGASAGQVIQVLGATDSTQRSTTSTSFVTGSNTLSVTITPSSASNKIAIFVSNYAYSGGNAAYYTIYRGATNLGGTNGLGYYNTIGGTNDGTSAYNYLDSPATTSATTYQVYFRTSNDTGYLNGNNTKSQIIVMEIKG
jgi:hypothetical protein